MSRLFIAVDKILSESLNAQNVYEIIEDNFYEEYENYYEFIELFFYILINSYICVFINLSVSSVIRTIYNIITHICLCRKIIKI